MVATIILLGLAGLLLLHFIGPESKKHFTAKKDRFAGNYKANVKEAGGKEMKMPDYYEEIIEKDAQRQKYLNMHGSI
ncbi:MAG: hypothetical protein HKL88_07220 [Bacteroidia bacterium]|jgi:hypothetical protein|nr:hypothetical protein [Bacteroidia bacterium]